MYPMSLVGDEQRVVVAAVNQGIDARLEALTDTTYFWNSSRLELSVGDDDVPVLIRRLVEMGDDEADNLAEIMVGQLYGRGEYGYLADEG